MLKIENELKWIKSLGGNLILMPTSLLKFWQGDDERIAFPSPDIVTDYDRACEVVDYVEEISVGNGSALIFGDLPSDTSCISVDSENIIFVRWIWADDEKQVESTLHAFSIEQNWDNTGITTRFESGDLILFDSVTSGENRRDSINVNISSGNYNVITHSHQPNDKINLFLIMLSKDT
jgi:hypothetical protein